MALQAKTRRVCFDAMLLGLSLVLSYLEAALPLSLLISLPGFKLGLANIIITLTFAAVSPYDAAVVSVGRILIMGLLFGNASSFFFSVCGGIMSYAMLWLLTYFGKKHFSFIGISVGCAAAHNVGQIFAAVFIFGSGIILNYLPILLIAAVIFGSLTGMLLEFLMPHFNRFYNN